MFKLEKSRSLTAELAVTQERLRFASDLHDIQGHHLQVIALKAELAERLIATDIDAAAVQLNEIRLTAKTAMEETRALVADLREVSLETEIENAVEVLQLAGSVCEVSVGSVPTNQKLQRLLALAVRESTTNILRHSSATSVSITLKTDAGSHILQIVNNGVQETPGSSAPDGSLSSGINNLKSRFIENGGSLHTKIDDATKTFVFNASLPALKKEQV